MSEEILIRKAEVTISTLRVGSKQVTKKIWDQIPYIYMDYVYEHQQAPLGYVVEHGKFSSANIYLFGIGGAPGKFQLFKPCEPFINKYERENPNALRQYNDDLDQFNVDMVRYNSVVELLKNATQIYIGA